jgi:hypothetical protein
MSQIEPQTMWDGSIIPLNMGESKSPACKKFNILYINKFDLKQTISYIYFSLFKSDLHY